MTLGSLAQLEVARLIPVIFRVALSSPSLSLRVHLFLVITESRGVQVGLLAAIDSARVNLALLDGHVHEQVLLQVERGGEFLGAVFALVAPLRVLSLLLHEEVSHVVVNFTLPLMSFLVFHE